jgi:ribosomal protein L22
MKYTFPVTEKMVCAESTFSISQLNAVKVCRVLNRKKFVDAKNLLDEIIKEEKSIKGKHYTKTAKEIFKLLEQLESNAKSRNIDSDSMILFISAHRGPTMHRMRRRRPKFGSRLKISHIKAVLGESNVIGRKVRERGNKK